MINPRWRGGESDFATERAGLRAPFRSFVRSEQVDAERILILGRRNGGGYAPLVEERCKLNSSLATDSNFPLGFR
jgi:hypothetical protein